MGNITKTYKAEVVNVIGRAKSVMGKDGNFSTVVGHKYTMGFDNGSSITLWHQGGVVFKKGDNIIFDMTMRHPESKPKAGSFKLLKKKKFSDRTPDRREGENK